MTHRKLLKLLNCAAIIRPVSIARRQPPRMDRPTRRWVNKSLAAVSAVAGAGLKGAEARMHGGVAASSPPASGYEVFITFPTNSPAVSTNGTHTGPVTPSVNGCLCIASGQADNTGNDTIDSGFTVNTSASAAGSSGSWFGGTAADLIQTTAATINPALLEASGGDPGSVALAVFAPSTTITRGPAKVAPAINNPATSAINTTGMNLFVVIANGVGLNTTSPPTDSASNTWVNVLVSNPGTFPCTSIWYCLNGTTSPTHTFTWPYSSAFTTLSVLTYAGVASLNGSSSALGGDGSPWVNLAANTPYTYLQSAAVQQSGNYTGPGFVQESWKSTNTDCPIIVYFRPDQSGGHMDIVFEYGYCGNPVGGGLNANAYNLVPTGYITSLNYNNSTGVTTFGIANASSIFTIGQPAYCSGFFGDAGNPAGLDGSWTVTATSGATVTIAGPSGLGLPSGENLEDGIWGFVFPTNTPNPITYTVDIKNNGVSVSGFPQAITNPHNWFARWRWQSAQRPIVNTPSQIISKGWWFNMGLQNGTLPQPSSYLSPPPYTYLGNAGVTTGMDTTGSRPDIGVINGWAGQWMINPNANNTEQIMRDAGEASSSIPNRLRDENTGAPLNSLTYPYAIYTAASGLGPVVQCGMFNVSPINPPWLADGSHYPDLTNILFKATFDPYILENLQFDCGDVFWETQALNGKGGSDFTAPLIQLLETRGWAWGMRTLVNAWHCAYIVEQNYGALPSWILPASHYAEILVQNYNYMCFGLNLLNAPNGTSTNALGVTLQISGNQPFMNCWVTSSLLMGLLYGAPYTYSNSLGTNPNLTTICDAALVNNTFWVTGGSVGSGNWPIALGCPFYSFYSYPSANDINTWGQLPGGWTPVTTVAELYETFCANYAPKFTASVSNGSGGAGTILNVTAFLDTTPAIGGIGTAAFPIPLFNGSTQIANIVSAGTGTGGTGTYNLDTALNIASTTLICGNNMTNFQAGARVPMETDPFNGGVNPGYYAGFDTIMDNRTTLCQANQLGLTSSTGTTLATSIGYINPYLTAIGLELNQYYEPTP